MSVAPDYQTPDRMALKLQAIPLPERMDGLRVVDVGCDMGYWSFLCAERGASFVIGIDRGRMVKGAGHTRLAAVNQQTALSRGLTNCAFIEANIGQQWPCFAPSDVALLFSLYHHIYAQVGEHEPIWYWLSCLVKAGGEVLWENPVDCLDPVAHRHIPAPLRDGYHMEAILRASSRYFRSEYIGPALHEPRRSVYRFTALPRKLEVGTATVREGSGGAAMAWQRERGARIREFEHRFGVKCIPGSLNARMPWDWDHGYLPALISDPVDRADPAGPWKPRRARVYPCAVNNTPAYAFRFDGEPYPADFIEFVSPSRLRETMSEGQSTVEVVR